MKQFGPQVWPGFGIIRGARPRRKVCCSRLAQLMNSPATDTGWRDWQFWARWFQNWVPAKSLKKFMRPYSRTKINSPQLALRLRLGAQFHAAWRSLPTVWLGMKQPRSTIVTPSTSARRWERKCGSRSRRWAWLGCYMTGAKICRRFEILPNSRSEEHTSELQSRG